MDLDFGVQFVQLGGGAMVWGLRVSGFRDLGFRGVGTGEFRVYGFWGLGVQGVLQFRVQGLFVCVCVSVTFRVEGLVFRVQVKFASQLGI